MIITSPHYNRPHCSAQMIESLRRCLGIEDVHVIFVCEPGCEDVLKICKESQLPSFEVVENANLLGLWTNKKKCLELGFEKGDFVIHIEDDLLLSRDALLFYKWCEVTYQSDTRVLNISPFSKIKAFDFFARKCQCCSNPFYGEVRRRERYTSIGFATWRDRYEQFINDWCGADIALENWRAGKRLHEVYPTLSRINHIGHTQGISYTDELAKDILKAGETPDCLSIHHTIDDIRWHKRPNLLKNPKGREWVKMADGIVRSRESEEFYKKEFYLSFWADSIDYQFGGFFE